MKTLAALPLDWTEDHTALLSYMAELTDWRWLARGPERAGESPRLEFGPWTETWTANAAHDVEMNAEPMRRYNRVVVPFRTVSGAAREAVGTPVIDPLPGHEVMFPVDSLGLRQLPLVEHLNRLAGG